MIVRETERDFIMIAQHDHAALSGDVAAHFQPSLFNGESYVEDVLYAIYEHDRSWIRLDDTPIWNDRDAVPFSFTDYPELPKLVLYRLGVDEIEQKNDYAALLCSLHYASFYPQSASMHQAYIDFIQYEQARQDRIRKKRQISDEAVVKQHYRLLQLCDRISLYVCLNEPGASKEKEHPWYRNGFGQSEGLLNPADDRKLTASWKDEEAIHMTPFPFKAPFTAALKYKRVSKYSIHQSGINQAYRQSEWQEEQVTFSGD